MLQQRSKVATITFKLSPLRELQHERDSLQDRMSEQTQRISALQSRLEEQRQRAEELQRVGTSDLNIRIHDLQTETQNLRETLSARDKQVATMKSQLEKSKIAIDRLEAELAVEQQPDRSIVERLEADLKQKNGEVQKLKERIKNEMINKLALPDLMETMLADKNEEIDHLKEQLETKEKDLQTALEELNSSQASSAGGGGGGKRKDEASTTKLSARTLSDIGSITEFDEPDVVRRAALNNFNTALSLLPEGNGNESQRTLEISKEAVADLTHKRTDDLSAFALPQHVNTFDHPHYFQDPNALLASGKSGATATPPMVPRQINFSEITEDSKVKTPFVNETAALKGSSRADKELVDKLQQEVEALKKENVNCENLQKEIAQKAAEIEQLLTAQEQLTKESAEHKDRLTKSEKNLLNYRENEAQYLKRIAELETELLKSTEQQVAERESLRKELRCLSETHEQCKYTHRDALMRKQEIEKLNQEIKAKDDRIHELHTQLSVTEESIGELQRQIGSLERELEKLRQQQQQNSDNSSKQFSVDEIAQQVEKELNYSAQLDSNILKAIESEEENNLDAKHTKKENQAKSEPQGTDDENFTGERELLNQLEVLRAQIAVEREQSEQGRQELLAEKQNTQEIQEQYVVIIDAMRKRLETALEKEDELYKQLDQERERCERTQTQLTALQRAESRRNSALLLKSPTESPRKSPRSLGDFEAELGERLRSEIKMLTAQNERERERSADVQRSGERERQRYETELQERVAYCEKLKREMDKVAREKDGAEQECEHLQERLTLQTQEIESLEARIATLQEAETRRSTRRERQQKESAQLLAELQELKTQLLSSESEREQLTKTTALLRYDLERSAQREAQLADALANANESLSAVPPQEFLQKMNELLAENTHDQRQLAKTLQTAMEERLQLQRRCEELEAQLGRTPNVTELEERCNHLLGRYLRVESHRKALVYQKRYLKISLQGYQDAEQRALVAINCGHMLQPAREKKHLFKTVALAIVAIQRMKYICRIWHTGKRIVSKSVFTITQQRRSQAPTISCPVTSTLSPPANTTPYKLIERPALAPLQTPALLSDCGVVTAAAPSSTKFDWSRGATTTTLHQH